MANKTPDHPQEAGPNAPKKWSTREDAYKHGGDYPNQNYTRTQSGHVIMFDDTKDKEHITLQHRSGARFQMGPTGDIQVIAHNGQYSIIFGENRMEVTGTHDVTIKGGGTLKVDGDYDVTVGGDVNMACDNDFNFKGKSFNFLGGGNFDMEVKNMTVKTEGSATIHSGGAAAITGGSVTTITSQSGPVAIAAASSVGVYAHSGSVALQAAGGNIEIYSPNSINMDGDGSVWINSGLSAKALQVVSWKAANHPTQQSRRGSPGNPGERHG